MAAPCAICGGALEEHGPGRSQHVYTQTPGELLTHAQKQKKQQQASSEQVVPQYLNLSAERRMARFCEVLVAKGLLDTNELMYIMTGVHPNPPGGD